VFANHGRALYTEQNDGDGNCYPHFPYLLSVFYESILRRNILLKRDQRLPDLFFPLLIDALLKKKVLFCVDEIMPYLGHKREVFQIMATLHST